MRTYAAFLAIVGLLAASAIAQNSSTNPAAGSDSDCVTTNGIQVCTGGSDGTSSSSGAGSSNAGSGSDCITRNGVSVCGVNNADGNAGGSIPTPSGTPDDVGILHTDAGNGGGSIPTSSGTPDNVGILHTAADQPVPSAPFLVSAASILASQAPAAISSAASQVSQALSSASRPASSASAPAPSGSNGASLHRAGAIVVAGAAGAFVVNGML